MLGTLTPADEAETLQETAQELLSDVMNQFGLDPQMQEPPHHTRPDVTPCVAVMTGALVDP
ncbi:hypothetical protein ABZ920_00800 [Streptomyces sp. NPDC046831]|uniref:hypothetical protein n=1 Tax=Streptomyces sp. NPDC046831 TaxID=3154805 RepID=UPI0033E87070